jgi:hypothetical protein
MARRKGFEPLTPRFEVWCSIQLSYRRHCVSAATRLLCIFAKAQQAAKEYAPRCAGPPAGFFLLKVRRDRLSANMQADAASLCRHVDSAGGIARFDGATGNRLPSGSDAAAARKIGGDWARPVRAPGLAGSPSLSTPAIDRRLAPAAENRSQFCGHAAYAAFAHRGNDDAEKADCRRRVKDAVSLDCSYVQAHTGQIVGLAPSQ